MRMSDWSSDVCSSDLLLRTGMASLLAWWRIGQDMTQESGCRDRRFAVGLGRDARLDPTISQGLPQPVGIVTPVAEQCPGLGQRVEHQQLGTASCREKRCQSV